MQHATLAEEWRERPDLDGAGIRRIGPYYKHQVWRDGSQHQSTGSCR